MASDGEGAVLDAQHASQILHIERAEVVIHSLTLANGYSSGSGGAISLRNGSMLAGNSIHIVDSSAEASGGAIDVRGGSVSFVKS
eukprot:4734591-Prymnesium_polylepis.1